MALNTILKFVLSWGICNGMFIVFSPVINTILHNSGWWNLMPPNVLAYGEVMYGLWIGLAIIIPAGLLIFAWREAHLKAVSGQG
jgi:hypothetical protein